MSIFFLMIIILAFLLRGSFLIYQIESIDETIHLHRNFSQENLDLFCKQIEHFEYFLYLFAGLIVSIISQFRPFKKNKKIKSA